MGFLDTALLLIGLERSSNSRPPKSQALKPQLPATKAVKATHEGDPGFPLYPFVDRRSSQSRLLTEINRTAMKRVVYHQIERRMSEADVANQISIVQGQLSMQVMNDADLPSATKAEVLSAQSESVRRSLALRRKERQENQSPQGHVSG